MTDTIRACFYMRPFLLRASHGKTGRILDWVVRKHTGLCPQCRATYRALIAAREGLRAIGSEKSADLVLSPERWAEIEAACESKPPSDRVV